jgi:hypothetical protein
MTTPTKLLRDARSFVRAKYRNDLLVDFNLAVGWSIRQTAKFNSPPNFPAIWYIIQIGALAILPTVTSLTEINGEWLHFRPIIQL